MKRIIYAGLLTAVMLCGGAVQAQNTILVPSDQPTIQQAINAASNGDEILVAPGVYNEAINFNGKAIHLHSAAGAEVTTIDAAGLDTSVVTCTSGEGSDTILEGFTITGGIGTIVGGTARRGGGMYNVGASPSVIGCVFEANSASSGGGMYNSNGSSPSLTECVFEGNSAIGGGGMYNINGSSPMLTDCVFHDNLASTGAGMWNEANCSPTLTGCVFESNSASTGGGMFNIFASSPSLTGCIFEGNSATDDGGGLWGSSTSAAQVEATLFCENTPNHTFGRWDDLGDNEFLDECPPDCEIGDLNCDGVVDVSDLLILLAAWGNCENCPADLNGDGTVDVSDLLVLLANWG